MILLPAVDIRDGKAVRLRQGRLDDETVYADDPLEAGPSFVEAGRRFVEPDGHFLLMLGFHRLQRPDRQKFALVEAGRRFVEPDGHLQKAVAR